MKIKLLPFEKAKTRFLLNLLVFNVVGSYEKEKSEPDRILGVPIEFWDTERIITVKEHHYEPLSKMPFITGDNDLIYPFCCCEVIEE